MQSIFGSYQLRDALLPIRSCLIIFKPMSILLRTALRICLPDKLVLKVIISSYQMQILGSITGEQISTRGIPCPVGYLDCLEYWSSSQILHAFVVSSVTLYKAPQKTEVLALSW